LKHFYFCFLFYLNYINQIKNKDKQNCEERVKERKKDDRIEKGCLAMAVASSSQPLPLTLPSISSSQSHHSLPSSFRYSHSLFTNGTQFTKLTTTHRRILSFVPSAGNEDADLSVSSTQQLDDDDDEEEPTPQDLENVAEIKRVSLPFLIFS